jgi:hypothetical protein
MLVDRLKPALRSAVVAAVLVLAPGLASAQEGDAHLANGLKLLQDKNYNGAIAELDASYRGRPNAAALLGIAEASHALHDDARAADALRAALMRFGATMSPAQRASVEAELAAFSAAPAPAPATATAAPPGAAAGPQVAPMPPPPPAEERRSTGMMVTGISLTGTGLIAGVVGFWLIGQADQGHLAQCGTKTCDPQQQRINGWVIAGAGGAAIAVGVPLLVVGARKVVVTPSAPRSAAGASLVASF